MPRIPVAQLRPAPQADSIFLLQEIEMRNKKNGDPYAALKLADATGSIPGVMWDNLGPVINRQVAVDDFVQVSGEIALYNNALQFVVKRIQKVPDSRVDLREYIAHTPFDIAELERQLDERIAEVKHPDCRRLLDYFLGKDGVGAATRAAFCQAPAAARIHQAYIGGLLEHTLAVLRNALMLAESYKPYDRDLLITGGLLHDLGKIREYDWRRVIRYTDVGRLVGHLSIGAHMVALAIRELAPFDERLGWNILHIVLSHHGKLEYGAPVVPKTREALLLHYGDYTDAYLASYCDDIERARRQGQLWTPYSRMFQAFLYAGPTRSDAPLPPAGEIFQPNPESPDLFGQPEGDVDDSGGR